MMDMNWKRKIVIAHGLVMRELSASKRQDWDRNWENRVVIGDRENDLKDDSDRCIASQADYRVGIRRGK